MKPETAAPPRTQALTDDDISVLANEVSVLEFEEEEQIMTEGDEASWFGIVQSGSLEALIGSDVINVMGAGAVVGEMAFFTAGRRLATVRGVMSGYIAFIALQDVCAVLEERPETGASLMRASSGTARSRRWRALLPNTHRQRRIFQPQCMKRRPERCCSGASFSSRWRRSAVSMRAHPK